MEGIGIQLEFLCLQIQWMIKAGYEILKSLGIRSRGSIISCPSCKTSISSY